jgi:hypothetical protein
LSAGFAERWCRFQISKELPQKLVVYISTLCAQKQDAAGKMGTLISADLRQSKSVTISDD